MIQQYQQRLRTPNYAPHHQNGGGQSHGGNMGNSNRGRGGSGNMSSGGGGKPQHRQNYNSNQKNQQSQNNSHQSHHNVSNNSKNSASASSVNSVQILEQYFAQNNLGELTFKTATMEMKAGGGNNPKNKAKKKTQYVSTVKVGEQSFQTFPNSYSSKEQAEAEAAALAINKLNISSNSNNGNNTNNNSVMSMPIGHFEPPTSSAASDVPQSDEAIEPLVDIILDLVGKRTNGVWSTQIEVEYKEKFKKALPDKWPDKIEASDEAGKKLRVDKPIADRYIIYPVITAVQEELRNDVKVESAAASKNTEAKKEPQQPSFPRSPAAKSSSASTQKRPPKLQLPEEPTWDVYITCVHRYVFSKLFRNRSCSFYKPNVIFTFLIFSTVNVCLRVLGDNYSSQFDDMVTNMELKYFENNQDSSQVKELSVINPEVGHLYAAKVEGDWHRVEVINVHGLEVTCYFIDHGDEDVLKVTDLRQLLPEFLELAPQAKSVRLAGL